MAIKMQPTQPYTVSFYIRGTSPFISHAWSDKALSMLRMTAAERKKQPKKAREPEEEAMNAMYKTADGEPGFPVIAFKSSLIGAAHKDLGIEKTVVRKALFLPWNAYDQVNGNLIAPLEFEGDITFREDIVRVGTNQTDLRYRPEFNKWRVEIHMQVDKDLLSEQDIVNLVNRAGFSIGVGEWRPEKGGEYGRFEFDNSEPMEVAKSKPSSEAA